MKLKDKIIIFILCLIVLVIYVISGSYEKINLKASKLYNVYLNGEIIGVLNNKDELYELIDEKQQSIKDKFGVQNVYPPNGLKLVETYSYYGSSDNVQNVYNKLDTSDDFTIYGYEIKIAKEKDKSFSIYVLNKEIFVEALEKFVLAFVPKDVLKKYLDGKQGDLEETKIVYSDMKVLEDIVIREKYISIKEKIYDNSDELAQDLLFGFNYTNKSYTVKVGDTIESIADANKLNSQEFLIANPEYKSVDSLLAIGDKVNVTLINPELSFTYQVSEIKEVEQPFNKEVVRDNSKPSSYSEITQVGVKGLTLQYQNYTITNGYQTGSMEIVESKVIREPVDQITTKGKKPVYVAPPINYGGGVDTYIDTGSGWRWPTITPNQITSGFGWRKLGYHNAIDIFARPGSNIYAANDGIVAYAFNGCPEKGSYPNRCGGTYGNHVVIDHGNNVYTLYAHMMPNVVVRTGQTVKRGQVIGYLGRSGQVTGYHLHFGLSIGYPGRGTYKNPMELFR